MAEAPWYDRLLMDTLRRGGAALAGGAADLADQITSPAAIHPAWKGTTFRKLVEAGAASADRRFAAREGKKAEGLSVPRLAALGQNLPALVSAQRTLPQNARKLFEVVRPSIEKYADSHGPVDMLADAGRAAWKVAKGAVLDPIAAYSDAVNFVPGMVSDIATLRGFAQDLRTNGDASSADMMEQMSLPLAVLTAAGARGGGGRGPLGPPARQQVEGDAFSRWFGDSKVRDAGGRPLRVFHGTNQPISAFAVDRQGASTRSPSAELGFFFTSDPEVASLYADHAARSTVPDVEAFDQQRAALQSEVARLEKLAVRTGDWSPYEDAMQRWEDMELAAVSGEDAGQNIVPAYLSLQNPKTVDFGGGGILGNGDFSALISGARSAGHDGLVLRQLDDTPTRSLVSDHYVVFDPRQIKSAVGNRGTFDPNEADIAKARGGLVVKRREGREWVS